MPDKLYKREIAQPWFGLHVNRTPPASLPHRFFTVLHNMTLDRGMPQTRPGVRRITGAQLGTSDRTVYAIGLWRATAGDLFITATDILQSVPVSGGDGTTLTNALPSGYGSFTGVAPTNMVLLNGSLHIVNTSSANRKFNGTSVTRMGLVAPSSLGAPSLSGGTITGTRNYRASLVARTLDGSGESDPTAVTSVTYAAEQGTFTAPTVPSSDPQVDRWNLYAEVAGTYYRVNTSPVTLATSIVDNVTDALLQTGTVMDAIGTNAVPPGNFQILTVHQGRLLGSLGTNVMYFSDLGLDVAGLYPKPHAWPAANLITFPETGGTSITAIISFFEWVVVFQQNGIWSVKGDLANEENRVISPLMVAPDHRGVGAPNQGCVAVLDNKIVFAGKDQPYAIKRIVGATEPDLSIEPLGDHIADLWRKVDFTQGAVSAADRYGKRWIFVGTGTTAI